MRKLSVKWVPKCLNTDEKRKGCHSSERFWNFSARSKWFPAAIGDHGRNLVISLWPDTKQQSMEWWHSGSSRLKEFRVQKLLGNFSSRFCGMKTESYTFIIFQMAKLSTRSITYLTWCKWRTLWWKNAGRGKVTKRGLILALQCPGSPGTCRPGETGLLVQFLEYPPYSPHLAPSDYHLFSGLKKQLIVRHVSSDAEVISVLETWLGGQISDFFWVACDF